MNPKIIISAIVVVILLVFCSLFIGSFYEIVPPGHRGVSVTLGKVSQQVCHEGWNWKKPFVETITPVPVKQISQDGVGASFSSDLQNIRVDYKVLYSIPENSVVPLYQNYAGDPYQALIDPRVQQELKQITALYRAEDIVKNREKIKTEVLDRIKKAVGTIIHIEDFSIMNLQLSADLENAIEQKVIQEQQALAKNFELEKAKKQAEITIVDAQAEAQSVKIKGEALRSSPDVIQLEIVKKWDGKVPGTVVTGKGGANVLLPIKE